MSQSATPVIRFPGSAALPLAASFDGGRLTSDGGLPWLEQADGALGLCAAFAAVIPDWRRGPVRHALATLVRQRVFQIACGYEDQDDADFLRRDPLLKLVCGHLPETGRDLASQPTFSRLENAVDRRAEVPPENWSTDNESPPGQAAPRRTRCARAGSVKSRSSAS